MNIALNYLKERDKLCCNFQKNNELLPQNKNNFRKDFRLTTNLFCLILMEEETKRKDRIFLPKCHSWKQRSVYFSFVLSNHKGEMQAGASLCLFICQEITHKSKISLSRAETFVFSFLPFPVELLSGAFKKICLLCFSCVVCTVTCVYPLYITFSMFYHVSKLK